MTDETERAPGSVDVPIEGVLDLHTFRPGDVKDLVPHYLSECMSRGILEVRIIHGKGTGALRATVLSILDRIPEVIAYRAAGHGGGGWGATIVKLKSQGPAPGETDGEEGRAA